MTKRQNDTTEEQQENRARTASEVLMLELLDVAERRGWAPFPDLLIRERARTHHGILERWRRSPVVVTARRDGNAGPPDNEAGDNRGLLERMDAAIANAAALATGLEKAPPSSEAAKTRAKRLLRHHANFLRIMPNEIREAVDRDLCDAHRKVMVCGVADSAKVASEAAQALPGYVPSEEEYPLHPYAISGLALSGGGVRSASFSLGAVQGLARVQLLRTFDFVSAVSGGSWTAGWLAAWAYRHKDGIDGVSADLAVSDPKDGPTLRWVRRHISYLAPRPGLTSGDTWALLVGYFSNWMPILGLIFLFLLTLTLATHGIAASAREFRPESSNYGWVAWGAATSSLALMAILRRLTLYHRPPQEVPTESRWIKWIVVAATLFSTISLAISLPALQDIFPGDTSSISFNETFGILYTLCALFYVIGYLFGHFLATAPGEWLARWIAALPDGFFRLPDRQVMPLQRTVDSRFRELYGVLISALIAALLISIALPFLTTALATPTRRIAYGPLLILVTLATAEVFGAIVSKRRDPDQAWSARLGGWMLAPVTAWSVLCTLSLGSTSLVRLPAVEVAATAAAIPLGVVSLIVVAVLFKRARDLGSVVGLIMAALMLPVVVVLLTAYFARDDGGHLVDDGYIWTAAQISAASLFAIAAICNVNRLSLHAIYKQGIVRTFLGASRLSLRNSTVQAPEVCTSQEDAQFQLRCPTRPTNVDENDNPALAWLSSRPGRAVPTLLINAAVNGISPTDREGRAPRQWPFTFSQAFCGSPVAGIGYAATDAFYSKEDPKGLTLGGAMAVSSAAVSPTSGHWTHPVRAFLLGVLNARLGMWIGNPHYPEAVTTSSPNLAGATVLQEMFGLRQRFASWIHLSDGGHFENLGIYELIRRGCLRIVAIDASCDGGRKFDDLAQCIRQAEIDLNVEIYPTDGWRNEQPTVGAPRELEDAPTGCIVFDIIYGAGLPRGRLYYIKPTAFKLEKLRTDVFNYARSVEEFPHESTFNQFFTERQMEAYRSLGESLVKAEFFDGPAKEATTWELTVRNLAAAKTNSAVNGRAKL